MTPLKVRELIEAAARMAQMQQSFIVLEQCGMSKSGMMNVPALGGVLGAAEHLLEAAREFELDATEASAERLRDHIMALRDQQRRLGEIPHDDDDVRQVELFVGNAFQTLKDQLKKRFALMLTPAEARLYEAKEMFGPDVALKFQDAGRDIEEASRCLALGRTTATVFHLMLAMERAVRKVAPTIGVDVLTANGEFERWGVLVGKIKAAIPALPKDRQLPWTEIHNLLWGVNKAWRNDTMHPSDAYTEQEAKAIYEAVKGFMQHLAPLV